MINFIKRAHQRAQRKVNTYRGEEDGATAIEFAIVAVPFFTILFAIIELAIVFFANSVLVHATSEAGRLIRVGNFQPCGAADEFKALVCSGMKGLGNCWNNVRIDVITNDEFSTLVIPNAPEPREKVDHDSDPSTPEQKPIVENGQYDATVGGDNVVIRATYYHQLALPGSWTKLEYPKKSGVRVMSATTAFRNEPFPASGTCENDIQDLIDGGRPE